MKKIFSTWLEESVYIMNDAQEIFLEKEGFEIEKPELAKQSDDILRDLGHYIKKDALETINLVFKRKTGEFIIETSRQYLSKAESIEKVKNRLDYLYSVIKELQKLDV